ncbi:sigma-70 family RNA polymerase sigma factor [Sedimentibacter hydroxybenzoicus DSM 7310]|uniref:Sigma-70 family RNA polymerase sigma factor n=1 Tax=Sedimentibacter hydroxybenzoicus DSM 7310 TaxID=1123245 RepID=A0A974GVN7_SEDHY|nr:sigma-70 family RNA polymerase sigma factor [Sedimentibacter hydroxybenzoicus]NYB73554.1 sigma-70 family RNA polymerase sigma factor [Sedimentibacter hydroxybenzoicus DSM 7310]
MDELYNEYFQTVFKYLFCLTHDVDLSEELTQETFCQAIKTYDKFRGDCKISVWLCQISKHLWYKELNKRKKNISCPIDEISDSLESKEHVESLILINESKVELFQKLQSLDEKTREVMYLRLTGELSFKEIGEILNKNETWARVTFYRAKQKLAKEGLD